MKAKLLVLAVLFAFLGAAFAVSESNAQTRRKRTNSTQKRVTPTPVPQTNEAVIISRADEQNDDNYLSPTEQNQTNQTENTTVNSTQTTNQNTTTTTDKSLEERVKNLESNKPTSAEDKQKRLAMNLEILSKAEQRAEVLRKQLFDMMEKQTQIQTRIEQINFDLRPEMIERYAGMAGTLRPEEVREARRRTLENEKKNLETLLNQITTSRAALEQNLQRADLMVDKLREKLEKEIDEAIEDK